MNSEQLYTMALTMLPQIGLQHGHELIRRLGSATAVFETRNDIQDVIPEASDLLVGSLATMDSYLKRCESELEWAEKNQIQCLTPLDEEYPQRLKQCPDAPLVLYYRGNSSLNRQHIISMVGTRKISEYGKCLCDTFVRDLSALMPDVLIFSGLAYGVDVQSHRAALKYGLETVGVLAHGLDQIYPSVHRDTAAEMLSHGGLLTEFPSGTRIDKYNFVQRNRIVAGCSDATIVVESAAKGGSLITADMAQGYDREVFAFPGRITDKVSAGCNSLIAGNGAIALLDAEQFVQNMGWQSESVRKKRMSAGIQQTLFPELDGEEQKIVDALAGKDRVQLNDISLLTAIPIGQLSGLLFTLEMKGVVKMMPGSSYRLTSF